MLLRLTLACRVAVAGSLLEFTMHWRWELHRWAVALGVSARCVCETAHCKRAVCFLAACKWDSSSGQFVCACGVSVKWACGDCKSVSLAFHLYPLCPVLSQGSNFVPVGNRGNVLVSSLPMKGDKSEQLWSHLVIYILLIIRLHLSNMICRGNFVNCIIHSHKKPPSPLYAPLHRNMYGAPYLIKAWLWHH